MRILLLPVMLFAASFLSGQQMEGLKTEKTTHTSILERKIPERSNDSIAKSNLHDIVKQKDNFRPVLGNTNPYHSEVQMNVNRLQNQVNTFNNNTFNRITPQGQGIEIKKRK